MDDSQDNSSTDQPDKKPGHRCLLDNRSPDQQEQSIQKGRQKKFTMLLTIGQTICVAEVEPLGQ
jgi:hypothetical protein